MALQFRNVDASPEDDVRTWPYEALVTALDRGLVQDWQPIFSEIRRSPWGPVARRVERYLSYRESDGVTALFRLAVVAGVVWWLLSMLWLKHSHFASDHDTHARAFKLAAGTLAVVPAWCALAVIHVEEPHGHRWLLLVLMVIWAADSGAYFVGRKLGRRKLSPRISPNKTVEGLLGGVALAQLPAVALVAVATVGFSVVGDLYESLLKRHVGAKDSGNLIPGHGGLLDRLDSVFAALPVFALGKDWLGF